MKKKSKFCLIMGLVLLALEIVFVVVALCNPQLSFPWSNAFTYGFICGYSIVTVMMFVLAGVFKRQGK